MKRMCDCFGSQPKWQDSEKLTDISQQEQIISYKLPVHQAQLNDTLWNIPPNICLIVYNCLFT